MVVNMRIIIEFIKKTWPIFLLIFLILILILMGSPDFWEWYNNLGK